MRRACSALALIVALWSPAALAQLVDLNTASQEELESLPGIGEKMAQEIINRRPIGSVDELLQIPRFGEARIARIRDLVTISGEAPSVSPEEADGPGADTAPPSRTARKPAPAPAVASEWHPPAGMAVYECWHCLEKFCVEAGTESGTCPYCGVRWGQRRAAP